MDLHHDTLNEFAESLRYKGKKPATVESYRRDAAEFLRYLAETGQHLDDVAPETFLAFQKHLASFDKENSIRRKVIGTRQFFRFFCEHQGQTDSPLDHVPIPERYENMPLDLSAAKLKHLIAHLDLMDSLKGARDLALVRLLSYEGLKATELIDLDWSDWLPQNTESSSLSIRGTRSRTIILQPQTTAALERYRNRVKELEARQQRDYQHMFLAFKGRDAGLVLDQMTRHGLKFLLYELGELVGLPKLNTEILRHHAVDFHLSQGHSPEEIMHHFGLRRLGNIAKHIHRHSRRGDSSPPTTGP
jgi:site-specific recombinase XerD